MCIDSISVIWYLQGTVPAPPQWAFLRCHKVMEAFNIQVRRSPDHTEVVGNEEVVRLAAAAMESLNPLQACQPTYSVWSTFHSLKTASTS